jgi:MOSC domain-containing protein YiiM
MKLLSVNVELPRETDAQGRPSAHSSSFKAPVSARVRVTRLNVAGDQQSDLAVDGGIGKAVYGDPAEHGSFWREELPGVDLPWWKFGGISRPRFASETACGPVRRST